MKGLLLAGGHGTRLRPLTFSGNKHLLPIANKPMLFYGLEHLRNAGLKEVAVVTGPIKEGVVEALGDGSKFGLEITYIQQPEPKGLAHAVLLAERFVDTEPFIMYLGDNLLKGGLADFVTTFEQKKANCVIGAYSVADPSRFGVVEMSKGRVVRLTEKPMKPRSDLALVGVYVFDESIFDAARKLAPSKRGELEITDAIQGLLDEGKHIEVVMVEGWWKDTGRPEDLVEANQLVLSDLKAGAQPRTAEGVSFSGNVVVGEGTKTTGKVRIAGPVVIGRNCRIGSNVYIGPYTSIGDGCSLKNVEIQNSIVMEGCTIESSKRIVDSIIGNHSTILDGTTNIPQGHKLIVGERSFAKI